MEGWRPVEDLVRWGFAHAPVLMANEAHNGLARCIRTREVGVRMIQAAHKAGVRRLAMEALPHRRGEPQGPILAMPPGREGYLTQPDMQRLIGAALDLGWTLWAYEAVFDVTPDTDQEHLWVYRCEAEGPFELDREEIETGAWFAADAVTKWMQERPKEFAGAFRIIWKRIVSGRAELTK